MDDKLKYDISRWLIFISFFVAISAIFYSEVIVVIYTDLSPLDSHSLVLQLGGLILCLIFLSGLYLGSRGLGIPLSFKLLIHLLFTYPNRIILVPYLLFMVATIFYYELFW